jgi:hypothetical protein
MRPSRADTSELACEKRGGGGGGQGGGWEDGRHKKKRRAELGGAEGLVSLLISNVKEQKTSKTTKPKLIKNAVPAAAAAVGGAPG